MVHGFAGEDAQYQGVIRPVNKGEMGVAKVTSPEHTQYQGVVRPPKEKDIITRHPVEKEIVKIQIRQEEIDSAIKR